MRVSLLRLSAWAALASSALAKQPNILFIITDDQDGHMGSIEHMPLLKKHLIDKGTSYENHFCTIAICCPSRVNLWTGRAAHNTNVTDVGPPYGGYPKIVKEGINDDYLPVWMQAAGYNTYYTGKLWNAHTINNYNQPFVKGYNGSDFLLDPFTYDYWHARMSRNGEAPKDYSGQYSPDVVADKAYGFLEEAVESDAPWFVTVAPIAPHSNIIANPPSGPIHELEVLAPGPANKFAIPEYAPRHAHLFKDYKIPRTEDFNPEVPSGASWIAQLPRLNDTMIDYNDEFQRARLRALQSVDEMIGRLVNLLDFKGVLEDTYIFFTTDNGFHASQHRMHPGKECGYDTDIHIPLVIRGPGITAGATTNIVTSHTDMAPTLLSLANATRPDFDGSAIPLLSSSQNISTRGEHINVEFWGIGLPEGKFGIAEPLGGLSYPNNTYKALRLVSGNYSIYYSVWCTGEHEFYNVANDPAQMHNLFADQKLAEDYSLAGRGFQDVVYRLDALLVVLKACKTSSCVYPWSSHHPSTSTSASAEVETLLQALDPQYDSYYKTYPKVGFSSCELGYIPEAEGNVDKIRFASAGVDWDVAAVEDSPARKGQEPFQYRGSWSDWV
ncbi:arylsulfatase [Aureobasidium sp. EXF-8845]|nr:arylsulfatase [Aureobasidium sp. EXF-8845]KAI4847202.1 arylsulfatase [Aureobasidium sp. EXF-8846]